MNQQRFKRLISAILLLCFIFAFTTSAVYAAQTKMDENDPTGGIPEVALPTVNIQLPAADSGTTEVTQDNEKDENIFVKGLRYLVVAIGDLLYRFLKPVGADIDTVIYNKSPSGTESKFKVDFTKNSSSPFSFMGRQLYTIFTSFALFIMFIILLTIGTKFQLSGTSRNKLDLKETLNNYVVSFLLIFWLPGVLNFVLQALNICVDAINPSHIKGLGSFVSQVEEGKTLSDAAVYLGTAALSFYFTVVYITRALHITMFYFMFPIMSTYMNGKKFKESFNTYISDLISTISIQLFDAALFLGLTVLFSKFGALNNITDAGFWKVIIAACIIPLRTMARKMLGFSKSSFGMDMLGMAGVMGAMGLARGFAGGAKNLVHGVGSGISSYTALGKVNDFAPEDISTNSSTSPVATRAYSSPSATYGHVDMGGGISRPITDKEEAKKKLLLHGSKQLFGSVGQAFGGVTGASVGAMAGIPFGLGGVMMGANMGGMLGGAAGDMAGNLVGTGIGSIPFSNDNAQFNQDVNEENNNKTSVSSSANLATVVNAGSMVPINIATDANPNSNDYMNERIGISDSSAFNGNMSQNAQDLFTHYINNIPTDKFADIEANAIKTAESYVAPLSKQYGTDKLGELYNGIKTSAMQQGAVEYAIGQIKNNHSVDVGAFESLNSDIKRQMINNIKGQVNNFFQDNGKININEV